MKRSFLALAFVAFSTVGCAGSYGYYAPTPPPPLRAEAYGAAPGPGYAWVGGYWGYRGNAYAWSPGRWAASYCAPASEGGSSPKASATASAPARFLTPSLRNSRVCMFSTVFGAIPRTRAVCRIEYP